MVDFQFQELRFDVSSLSFCYVTMEGWGVGGV